MTETVMLRLNELMDAKALTRNQLAKQTGLDYATVDKYYKNKVTRYDSYVLYKICKALDCAIGDLIVIRDIS